MIVTGKALVTCDACGRQQSTDGGIPPGWRYLGGNVHVCGTCMELSQVEKLVEALTANLPHEEAA